MTAHPFGRGRRAIVGAAFALALVVSSASLGSPGSPAAALGALPTGLGQLLTTYDVGTVARGIAVLPSVPTAGQVGMLQGLGLAVQPMRHVPLALVVGTVGSMQAAVSSGLAEDVYPDLPLELLDTTSSDAMGAAAARAAG